MLDVKGVAPNAVILRVKWKTHRRTPEENRALEQRAKDAKCFFEGCEKTVTRHLRHTYYSCSDHWPILGLREAARVEGWRKTFGKAIAVRRAYRIAEERREREKQQFDSRNQRRRRK